jgi:hypothetical protein
MEEYKNTRPYQDCEVPAVIERLLANGEFIDFLGRYHSPRLARMLPGLVSFMARRKLGALLGEVRNIADFQGIVATYARKIVAETMSSFRCEGIERLARDQTYLFVSNHRDIAGDSMLVDLALFDSGYKTVRIAVGDNLVQREFATDVMRLNKSFFIRRSEEGTKKIYAALLDSSRYISQSLGEGESVWIAQAEGRAKSGMDLTDPALIKMFVLAARKTPFAEVINGLNIVPVSLSYEFDPCDELKARELHAALAEGNYVKPPGEDLLSLVKGLGGYKGDVRLRFGEVLCGSFETPEEVAGEIDRQILANLTLFPINFLALRELSRMGAGDEFVAGWREVEGSIDAVSDPRYEKRLARCPVAWRTQWLAMYANPVVNKLQHGLAVSLGD